MGVKHAGTTRASVWIIIATMRPYTKLECFTTLNWSAPLH